MNSSHTLQSILLDAVGSDNAARVQAQRDLDAIKFQPGYVVALCELLIEKHRDAAFASLALLCAAELKNHIRLYWRSSTASSRDRQQQQQQQSISDDDRDRTRPLLVRMLFELTAERRVRSFVVQAFAYVCQSDFPTRMPTLLDELLRALHSNDVDTLHRALVALRHLLGAFDDVPVDLATCRREPVTTIGERVLPRLLPILEELNHHALVPGAAELASLVLQSFWRITRFFMPVVLCGDFGSFTRWMNAIASRLLMLEQRDMVVEMTTAPDAEEKFRIHDKCNKVRSSLPRAHDRSFSLFRQLNRTYSVRNREH